MAARNMDDIAEVLKTLKFRKQLFGGVSERDVWKQLEKLQAEYRSAYEKQQERYEVLLKEREEQIKLLQSGRQGESVHE
jgi:hypothetical protein